MNIGRILLLLSTALLFILIYQIMPPHDRWLLFIVFIIVQIPLLWIIWNYRGKLVQKTKSTKLIIFILGILGIVLITTTYIRLYEKCVYNPDPENFSPLFYPFGVEGEMAGNIENVNRDLKFISERYGIDFVIKEIKSEATTLDFAGTLGMFLFLFLIGTIIAFSILALFYLEVAVENIFDFKNNNTVLLRREILDLVVEDKIKEALTVLINGESIDSERVNAKAIFIKGQNTDLENKFSMNIIGFDDYLKEKSKIRWALLNLIS